MEQSGVWLDDLKTFAHRSIRCASAIHPYPYSDSACAYLPTEYLHDFCTPGLQKDKRVMLNKRQKKTLITGQTSISKEYNTLWHLLGDTIPPRRTIMRVVTATVELYTMAFPGVNGLLLTEDHVAQVKKDYTRQTNKFVLVRVVFAAKRGHDRQQTVSHCNYPVTLECLRLCAHERTARFARSTDDLQSVDSADIIGTIA